MFVLCWVLLVKAVLLQCLHLQVAVDYLGLFMLLLSWEFKKKKKEIVDEGPLWGHCYQDFLLACCFWFN